MNVNFDEIEESLILVYRKNLEFLKKNFFDIFEEVEKLSQDINDNKVNEKYSLELKDGYFDILNLENNGYYYAKNSYDDAEKRLQYVNNSKESSFNLLRKRENTEYLAYPVTLKEVLPIIEFINDKVNLIDVNFKRIMKFIYIGTGLGYHISEIDKKINSLNTLIIEPELEIFRLSLFTTDYSIFEEGNRKLFLSIGDDKIKRHAKIDQFNAYRNYLNYNIKHYSLLKKTDYILDELTDFFHNNFVMSFPYPSIIRNVKKTIGFIKNKDRFLHVGKLNEENIFKNKKLLLISAGPSLDNYIETIKKYQDKFVIVCVDVILKKLEKHNIIPNIVFSIDPSSLCASYLKTEDPEYLKESTIILLSQQHSDVMELLRKRNMNYYFSQFSPMIEELGYLGSVPNVGTFTFQIMVYLGAKELYLIGNDAAFNQETGSRYSEDSSYLQTEKIELEQNNKDVISRDDVIEVEGNLRKVIKTNRSLLEFKYHFDNSIAQVNKYFEYKAYNLSDGVLIDGFTPMKSEEFIKISESNEIVSFNSKNNFDKISIVLNDACYFDDIKIINAILLKVKKFQKTKVSTADDFMSKKIDLMIWILEKTKKLSLKVYGMIFLQYTSIVDAYINFAINLEQKGLYKKKNLEQLKNYWIKGVISVFKDLKNAVS